MKKLTIAIVCLVAIAALTLPLSAAPVAGSWTGWITDSHCGAKGAGAEHKDCAKKCLDGGASLLLFNSADKNLYKLDKQDLALEHLGHEVKVTGKVDGDKIAVESIVKTAA